MVIEITTLKDEKVQFAKSLNYTKESIKNKKFLIEGEEALNWAINSNIKIDYIFISKNEQNLIKKYSDFNVFTLTEGLLKKITETNYLIPIVAVGNIKENKGNKDFLVVLDNLQDFGNIGTIVRTCSAFGINEIISTKRQIDFYKRKAIDSSRGKIYSTNIKLFDNSEDTINWLKQNNYQIITTSPYGDKIQSLVKLDGKPIALILGNETEGVNEEFLLNSDLTIQIPMSGNVESLNVGVAAGISIYELKLKQILGIIVQKIRATLGREINVTAMFIKEVLDKELKKVSDLSSTQLVFLMVLKCDEVMTVTDMQKQFGITDIELESFLYPLSEKLYINKVSNDNLIITEIGAETIGKLWSVVENAENKILEIFTENEKQQLLYLTDKLKNRCLELIGKERH